LIIAVAVLGVVCIAAQVFFWVGMSGRISEGMRVPATTDAAGASRNLSPDSTVQDSLSTYLLILMGITACCFGAVLYLLMKKVVIPLRNITAVMNEIAGGNLGVTVPSAVRNEVGNLGQTVNDVAANFQEVLLVTGTTVGNVRSSLEEMEKLLQSEAHANPQSRVQEHLEAAKRDVDCLGSVVKSFKFYQTSFNGWDVKHACPEEVSK
jgi:methyl-accepting chemotaxis protein